MSSTARTKRLRPRAARAPHERPPQILDAAARVLLRTGLSATIDDIAAEAGLGKGTVYEYFGSKGQIFTALRRQYTKNTLEAGELAVLGSVDGSALDRVRRFVAGMFEFAVANAELVALLFHEAGIEEDDELAPVEARLLELVRAGVDTGEFKVADPGFTVEFMLHGLHGIIERAFARGQPPLRALERADPLIVALLNPGPSRLSS